MKTVSRDSQAQIACRQVEDLLLATQSLPDSNSGQAYDLKNDLVLALPVLAFPSPVLLKAQMTASDRCL